MKRVLREFNGGCCCMCDKYINRKDLKNRRWEANDTNARIVGIAFMTEDGTPVEGFDLCDDCIGKLYSKLIY